MPGVSSSRCTMVQHLPQVLLRKGAGVVGGGGLKRPSLFGVCMSSPPSIALDTSWIASTRLAYQVPRCDSTKVSSHVTVCTSFWLHVELRHQEAARGAGQPLRLHSLVTSESPHPGKLHTREPCHPACYGEPAPSFRYMQVNWSSYADAIAHLPQRRQPGRDLMIAMLLHLATSTV